MDKWLIDAYDAAMFDLDGVIYRGPEAVPGAAEAVAALRDRGLGIGFVTNNAARTPADVARQLDHLGIPCAPSDVAVSSQALARLMRRQLPRGASILVAGPPALCDEMRRAGFRLVIRHDLRPEAVVQGYHPELPWSLVDEACLALADGAAWYATNADPTRPTERGDVPGAGSQVAILKACFPEREPVIAGKPCTPLLDDMKTQLGSRRPILVGDRIDTDVTGAVRAGIDSMLVLTGAHGKADLVAAPLGQRPTFLGWDVRGLVQPPRRATSADATGSTWTCGQARARAAFDLVAQVEGPLTTWREQLDALWALASLCWHWADRRAVIDAEAALAQLTLVP
ncbi:MAG: HAD-IIA family hydrolase [Actinomycetia bacterium]|nr:HAD-IIA family hydrolase [Actinomycetes bacterium]